MKMKSEHSEECILCCREIDIYAISECDHPICYLCFTRLKVLCEINYCTVCRKENSVAILTQDAALFSDIQDKFSLHDRKYCVIYENKDVKNAFHKILEHQCKECEEVFPTFRKMQDHVRRKHEMFYCELCNENLKMFSFEKKYYSRKDLATHKRNGDPDDSSQTGHPLCEFCDQRFVDLDELFRHLRKDHFFCHFCDVDGKHQYYNDYSYLRSHFRKEHYLCEEDNCINEQFTSAFRTEIDLKAHIAVNHSRNKSKAEAKQARMLDLEFSYVPAVRPSGSSSPRGGRFAQNRRRNLDENAQNRERENQQVEVVKPNTDSVQEFPFLSDDARSSGPDTALNYSSIQPQSRALPTAYRKNVMSAEDFPALCSAPVPTVTEQSSQKMNPNLSTYKQTFAAIRPSTQSVKNVVPDHNGNSIVGKKVPQSSNHAQQQGPNWGTKKNGRVFEEEFPSLEIRKKSPLPSKPNVSSKNSNTSTQVPNNSLVENSSLTGRKSPEAEKEKVHSNIESTPSDHFVIIKGKTKKKKRNKEYNPPPPEEETDFPKLSNGRLNSLDDDYHYNKYKTHPLLLSGPKIFKDKSGVWREDVSFVTEDFPPLAPADAIKKPPGFSSTKSRGPPPGFSSNPAQSTAPTVAYKTLSEIARETIRLTPKPPEEAPPVVATQEEIEFHSFIAPPHSKERNDELLMKIASLCHSQNCMLDEFKLTSGKFRNSAISAASYYCKCLALFGEKFYDVFPELVSLLPDIEKQQELFAVHITEKRKQANGKRAPKPTNSLVTCDNCQQVMLFSDCNSHKLEHAKLQSQ